MIRTVISLDEESKRWLDQQAREENVSTAELIRTAVRKYRDEKTSGSPLNDLLKISMLIDRVRMVHQSCFGHAAAPGATGMSQ